jgi:hypothetical protein
MNLREQLLKEHSKKNTQLIMQWVGHDPDRFAELMPLFLEDEYRVGQRAAWVVSGCADQYPDLIQPHLADMVRCLENPIHPAISRNALRALASLPNVPEELQGELVDRAFTILLDPKQPVAIHVHAMQVLANLCAEHPDLGPELRLILEDNLEGASKGYLSRAKRILQKLPL